MKLQFDKKLFVDLYVRLYRLHRHQEKGYILVVVVGMLVMLHALLMAYAIAAKIEGTTTIASAKSSTGFYGAEAGLNLRAMQILDEFEGFNRPQGTSPSSWEDCTDASTANDGTGDFDCDSKTFQKQAVATFVQESAANPSLITIDPGELFAGLSAQEFRYDLTSVARGQDDLPSAMLTMRFRSRVVPMFQFLAFYNNDLDVSIPPTMNLNGRVHSNANLYLDAANSNTLTINGQVSAVDTVFRGSKQGNTCSGTVNIFNPTTASPLPCAGGRTTYTNDTVTGWNDRIVMGVDRMTIPEADSFDPTPGRLYWDRADLRVVLRVDGAGNPTGIEVRNQNGSENATATTSLLNNCPVTSTTLRPEDDGSPNYGATDVDLIVDSTTGFAAGNLVTVGDDIDSNVIRSIDSDDNEITLRRRLGHDYQPGTVASENDIVRRAVVSTSDTFYNYREKRGAAGTDAGTYIRMLNVDVRRLLDCAHSQNLMGRALDDNTDGGLVWFLTVDGPDSDNNINDGDDPNNYGVRLYNGGQLGSTVAGAPEIEGLTIVSDQAVYIRGNYNSTNKRPASILADTINVLSNSWSMNDSDSRNYDAATNLQTTQTSLVDAFRVATDTTINAAFLAGTEITGGVNGTAGHDRGAGLTSGGLNNYPRFHENWTGAALNYRGSFVSLDRPRRISSPFCGSLSTDPTCNIYSPPSRNWDYDTDFNNAANLPPLTPRFTYLIQEIFSRDFDR